MAPSPNVGKDEDFLDSVSCPSRTSCFAAGVVFVHYNAQGLVERWIGGRGWEVLPSPHRTNTISGLTAVSCISTRFCMAGGHRVAGAVERTWTERWNGRRWIVVRTPNLGARNDTIQSVSCAGRTSCEATESFQRGRTFRTIVLRWTAGRWRALATPNPGSTDTSLFGSSCPSRGGCVHVGQFNVGALTRTLVVTGR